MPHTSINLSQDRLDERAYSLPLDGGAVFICLVLSSQADVILPGLDEAAVKSARAIAKALTDAADLVDVLLAAKQQPALIAEEGV